MSGKSLPVVRLRRPAKGVRAVSCALLAGLLAAANVAVAAPANLPDFTQIAKNQSRAVVKIAADEFSASEDGQQSGPGDWPEELRDFFNIPRERFPRRFREATGSGFIISSDGYVVTNYHIVEGASKVEVLLQDRREYEAEVVGSDLRSDLTLLKIDGKDLPSIELPRSVELEVGEWVVAIGSPFGLDYSVTAGIVSAIGRNLPGNRRQDYVPFIQTDVAINPGNSGGPLFNLQGQLVGVNSQIYSNSGGSIGLSFAIPLNVVRDVVEQLRATGEVRRGWLGVTIQSLDGDLAESFGLSRPAGALITAVESEGPAEKAGMRAGDVIMRFNGVRIIQSSDLPPLVGLLKPEEKVPVEILREGRRGAGKPFRKTLQVRIGLFQGDEGRRTARSESRRERLEGRLGFTVVELTQKELEDLGIRNGVAVQFVKPGGAADKAGLVTGDVLTVLSGKAVRNLARYEKILADLPQKGVVRARVIRRGAPLYLAIRLD